MPTPCNACPACPVGQNDRTGVSSFSACLLAKNDRIGGDRLDLLNRGHVIPLGLYAPCSMHHACRSTGVQPFLKKVSHKAPLTHNEGGAFLF